MYGEQSGGQLPSYEAVVAHQQALGQHVQRLTDELAKLRRNSTTMRRSDGDHALLSRKPLSGYMYAPFVLILHVIMHGQNFRTWAEMPQQLRSCAAAAAMLFIWCDMPHVYMQQESLHQLW